jgi:hypothetical protein
MTRYTWYLHYVYVRGVIDNETHHNEQKQAPGEV